MIASSSGSFWNGCGRLCRRLRLWEELKTDWVCLDCELMPWSAKAQELLQQQYAPTGAAARHGLPAAIESSGKRREA